MDKKRYLRVTDVDADSSDLSHLFFCTLISCTTSCNQTTKLGSDRETERKGTTNLMAAMSMQSCNDREESATPQNPFDVVFWRQRCVLDGGALRFRRCHLGRLHRWKPTSVPDHARNNTLARFCGVRLDRVAWGKLAMGATEGIMRI